MAGGIFTDRPFHFNTKCILFSFYSALLFYAGGGKNPLLIVLIFIMAYVLMAWYDYAYECNNFMYTGSGLGPGFHMSPPFKPQHREKNRDIQRDMDEQNLVADQEKAYLQNVYFFHVAIVAPTLLYIGYYGTKSHPNVFGFIGGMGALAGLYHGGRMFYPREVWA